MSKVILISTKKPPDWEAWTDLKSRKKTDKARVAMTQTEALSIFQSVINAESSEDARNFLEARMTSRKHLSHWLGQLGRRHDVRLGNGRTLRGYIAAIVERLRSRTRDDMTFLGNEEGKEMKKKDGKPVVVIRKGKSPDKADEAAETVKHAAVQTAEQVITPADAPPEQTPPISRLQDYALKTMRIFADCAVQTDASGIFDVLARNFEDKPALNGWLFRAGFAHLSKLGRNQDIVDFIRVVSREIHRDMKQNVGKHIARW